MLITLFMTCFSSLAITMFLAVTPLHLSFLILMFAMVSTFWFAIYTSTWFALTMFMVYIGGMLVMFTYFVVISPNYNISIMPLMLTFLASLIIMSMLMKSKTTFISFSTENSHLIMSFPFFPLQAPILLFMIFILLLALIFVVKIANRSSGPLRPFL